LELGPQGIAMHDDMKGQLAQEFGRVMRHIRENNWSNFCEAADKATIDPYVALGVLLVQIIENTERTDPSNN
jgi:hypothetical protein